MKSLQNILLVSILFMAGNLFAQEMAKPALDGYCPVCYIASGKAVKGSEKFTAENEGKVYYFVNQEAVDAFVKEPAKYLPAYDGYCAYGMAFGKEIETDPTAFSVVDGKLYLNKNNSISKKFKKDPKGFIAKADAEWKKMKK